MDSLGRLQQRIVSPALKCRSSSPERNNPRGWGIRRSRGLSSRYHSAPLSASTGMHRGRSKPQPMATRRGQFSTSGSTAPGSSRANSPQKSFTEYLSDVIIPIPIQMPVDEFNIHKSSGAQSFCSTSKMKYVALPHVSESRASSVSNSRPGSRPIPMCSERYMVTPVTQISMPKSLKSPRPRPKSEQQQRFEEGNKALARCRVLKRTSEILSHRMDRLYYMSGVHLDLRNKYATDEEALKRMQALAQESRMLKLKNNSPCDSLPKLSQAEAAQDLANGDLQPAERCESDGQGNCDTNHLNNETNEESNSFFITQNGVGNACGNEARPDGIPNEENPGDGDAPQDNEESAKENDDSVKENEEERSENAPAESSSVRPGVRERRRLLFGTADKPNRDQPLLSKDCNRRVSVMYERYKYQEESKEEELEQLASSDESSEEDEDQTDKNDYDAKIREMIRKGHSKKLQYEKSIFKGKPEAKIAAHEPEPGVKYTSSVHQQEQKKEEFREVTQHLVVKQEGHILYVEPNMDKEQAELFSKLFNDMDVDNNGRIELEELQNKLFRHLKSVDLPHFLRVFDLNGDRRIDRREFMAVAGLNDKLCKQRTTKIDGDWNVDLEKLSYYITVYKEMFDAIDIDHDGRLTLEELMVIIAASLDEETGTDVDLMEDILESIDKDGSGYIDFVGYLTYIPMFLQIHNYLMRKPMMVEDIEKSRRVVRAALLQRNDSESSADNIWD